MRSAFALPLTLAFVSAVQASVYRCADERGGSYYSDLPAAGRPCERIRTTGPDPEQTGAARQELAERAFRSEAERLRREEEERKRREREEKGRRQAEDCRRAREQLEHLQGPGRVARINQRGERELLTAAERQSAIAETQKRIVEICP